MSKSIFNFFNKTSIQILTITLITSFCYLNILPNGLSYDDKDFLIDWPAVRDSESGLSSFLNLPDLLAGDLPSHHRGVYRPVRSVLYLLNLKIWNFSPFIFHLEAITTHILITVLIYQISKNLINKKIAFITALLFASHPIHTEAVTYTAASFDTVGILFFFASFYFYLHAQNSTTNQKSTRLLSWLFAFLAFFTYEMTLMLPILIVLYEICFNNLNFKIIYSKIRALIPYFGILIFYIVIRLLLLHIGSRGDYLGPTYLPASNQAKLGIIEILYAYISLLIFPKTLTIAYTVPEFSFSLLYKITTTLDFSNRLLNLIGEYIFIFPPIFISLLLFYLIKLKKYSTTTAFCLSWFIISLIPVLNIIPQGAVMAERYLYIPSYGFCLLISILIAHFINKLHLNPQFKLLTLIASVVIITTLYSARTMVRNFDWHSEESIFLSALRDNPRAFVPNGALSSIKLESKQYDESIKYSKAALQISPDSFEIYHRLGLAYEAKNEISKAIENYNKALQLEKNYFYSHIQLGNIYKSQNILTSAKSEYQKALEIEPANLEARFNLAGIYLSQKQLDEALNEYLKILQHSPKQTLVLNNIGYIYGQKNDYLNSVKYYSLAVELDPNNYYFNHNLADAYQKNSQLEKASIYYKRSEKIKNEEMKK